MSQKLPFCDSSALPSAKLSFTLSNWLILLFFIPMHNLWILNQEPGRRVTFKSSAKWRTCSFEIKYVLLAVTGSHFHLIIETLSEEGTHSGRLNHCHSPEPPKNVCNDTVWKTLAERQFLFFLMESSQLKTIKLSTPGAVSQTLSRSDPRFHQLLLWGPLMQCPLLVYERWPARLSR